MRYFKLLLILLLGIVSTNAATYTITNDVISLAEKTKAESGKITIAFNNDLAMNSSDTVFIALPSFTGTSPLDANSTCGTTAPSMAINGTSGNVNFGVTVTLNAAYNASTTLCTLMFTGITNPAAAGTQTYTILVTDVANGGTNSMSAHTIANKAAAVVVDPCNATAATYTNGAAGTCTSATMLSGTTCQTTCNAGYLVAGTSSCSNGILSVAACDASTVASSSPDTAKTGVATSITLVTTNVAADANTMWKIVANGVTCGGTNASDKVGAWAAGTATYVSATLSNFSITVPSGTNATGSNDYVLCVATTSDGTYTQPTDGAEQFDVTVGATCNATSATYTNGAAGTCTSQTMASGTTCQSICDATHTTAGTSSCVDGTLTVPACNANVCTRPLTAGYVYSNEDSNCLIATGTVANCSASLTCATGYTGTPVATLCTTAGAYSVTGCTEVTTTTAPTTATTTATTTTAPTSTANTTTAAAAAIEELSVATQASTSIIALFGTMIALFLAHL